MIESQGSMRGGERMRLALGMAGALAGLSAVVLVAQVLGGWRAVTTPYDDEARKELSGVLEQVAQDLNDGVDLDD